MQMIYKIFQMNPKPSENILKVMLAINVIPETKRSERTENKQIIDFDSNVLVKPCRYI